MVNICSIISIPMNTSLRVIIVLVSLSLIVFSGIASALALDSNFHVSSPKQQMSTGIPARDVLCNSGLSLMIKFYSNSPICVKPSTAVKLTERNLGKVTKDSLVMDNLRQTIVEQKTMVEQQEIVVEQKETLVEQQEIVVEQKEMTSKAYNPEIILDNFVSKINNKFFTLTPGTTYLYESETKDGLERIEVTVTEEKRLVMGVETTVVWDRVWLDGKLLEDTKDWYAQDKEGNVWYFGEYSQEFEDGKFIGTSGSWEAGIDGAKPGIVMLASPQIGDIYKQEYYFGVAEDMGEILSLDETVLISNDRFYNCLKTKDWNSLEPEVLEFKYYCSEVGGLVLEENSRDQKTVELIDVGSDKLMTDITVEEAKKIALETVPGQVTDIVSEGYGGKAAYAVEIVANNGIETDVFVDIKTGIILGIET
jgi:hypothetical protein